MNSVQSTYQSRVTKVKMPNDPNNSLWAPTKLPRKLSRPTSWRWTLKVTEEAPKRTKFHLRKTKSWVGEAARRRNLPRSILWRSNRPANTRMWRRRGRVHPSSTKWGVARTLQLNRNRVSMQLLTWIRSPANMFPVASPSETRNKARIKQAKEVRLTKQEEGYRW
mgnify:CR=1 FL=1